MSFLVVSGTTASLALSFRVEASGHVTRALERSMERSTGEELRSLTKG